MKRKKEEIEKALKEAKKLEEHIIPEEEIITKYKEGLNTLEKLKRFLKPSWFIKEKHRRKIYK